MSLESAEQADSRKPHDAGTAVGATLYPLAATLSVSVKGSLSMAHNAFPAWIGNPGSYGKTTEPRRRSRISAVLPAEAVAMWAAWRLSVFAVGSTCFDHCQTGSNAWSADLLLTRLRQRTSANDSDRAINARWNGPAPATTHAIATVVHAMPSSARTEGKIPAALSSDSQTVPRSR